MQTETKDTGSVYFWFTNEKFFNIFKSGLPCCPCVPASDKQHG